MEEQGQTDNDGPLAGRVALVMGASSGIGEGAALALAAAGAAVAVSARRADRLADLVRRITGAGGTAIALPGDASDEATAGQVVAQTLARFGRLDILVNSAGIIREGGVEGADTAEWRQVLEVNLLACLYSCKAAIGPMKAQGRGDIINITSLAARQAGGPFGSYAVSKFGLAAMTEGLRQEVGGHGIRVCSIEPGATATEVAEGVRDPHLRQFLRDYVARDGGMKPDDVAEAVVFVCSLPARANVSRLRIRPTIDTVAHPALATNEGLMP